MPLSCSHGLLHLVIVRDLAAYVAEDLNSGVAALSTFSPVDIAKLVTTERFIHNDHEWHRASFEFRGLYPFAAVELASFVPPLQNLDVVSRG